ncbi:hypothetical protein BCR43DRAFT_489192 [Syncephalastrum racemosum]|uniref:Uncharacterized protein n=1 Tax=Syncephalastrum racemosum TaxID=13706 RepID=A0A1X2HK54_SYNRA|nr:hypothetical protein BCR43DRAFT_489192 [Syncephalastrum racemosum]
MHPLFISNPSSHRLYLISYFAWISSIATVVYFDSPFPERKEGVAIRLPKLSSLVQYIHPASTDTSFAP